MTPVNEPLLAPNRHVTPPKGVDGVIVNVRRVAQEPFYCLRVAHRIQREWDSSSIGYAIFGSIAILADHLISGLMLKWNVLYHRLWTSNRAPTGGEAPGEKPVMPVARPAAVPAPAPEPAAAPNPLLAALFDAYLAQPDKNIEELLADENVRKTYEDIS